MADMDLNSILSSVDSRNQSGDVESSGASVDNSESTAVSPEETSSSTTSVAEDESENGAEGQGSQEYNAGNDNEASGATNTGVRNSASETEGPKQRKSYHRTGSSELNRAQYSASKWQKKYRRLKEDFDKTLEEFNQYKDLDVGRFENEEDRQQYLAWKASKAQRLQDMSDDMNGVRNAYAEQMEDIRNQMIAQDESIYQEKVEDIYGDSADQFRALDNQWGDVFEVACNHYDKGNVVRDFIKNSNVGPAIKNVLYQNPQLQEDLFERSSGNAMIDASERLRILKGVEKSIYKFLDGNGATQQAPMATKTAKRSLPHLPPRGNQAQKQTVAAKPQVTGSLTRGNSVGGERDIHSEVSDVYHSIFG